MFSKQQQQPKFAKNKKQKPFLCCCCVCVCVQTFPDNDKLVESLLMQQIESGNGLKYVSNLKMMELHLSIFQLIDKFFESVSKWLSTSELESMSFVTNQHTWHACIQIDI